MTGGATQLSFDDDSGSETLARYGYQLNLTALECLRMLVDSAVTHVVCEWAEDYVVGYVNRLELVSVKHLEPSRGAWNLSELISDGGLQHLFSQWKKDGKKHSCRLQTNGGLKTGKSGASGLLAACNGKSPAGFAALVSSKLDGKPDEKEVEEFFKVLTIQPALPKRDDLLAQILVHHLPAIASEMGWPQHEHGRRFEIIQSLVTEAAESDIQAARRDLNVDRDAQIPRERALELKTVTRDRIFKAMSPKSASTTTMARKLQAGGFGPTDIEKCKRLRSDWLSISYQIDSGFFPDPELSALRESIQDLALAAENATRVPGGQYGILMRSKFIAEASVAFSGEAFVGFTPDQLLGAVYDETDRCNVWWSDHFDVQGQG